MSKITNGEVASNPTQREPQLTSNLTIARLFDQCASGETAVDATLSKIREVVEDKSEPRAVRLLHRVDQDCAIGDDVLGVASSTGGQQLAALYAKAVSHRDAADYCHAVHHRGVPTYLTLTALLLTGTYPMLNNAATGSLGFVAGVGGAAVTLASLAACIVELRARNWAFRRMSRWARIVRQLGRIT